jgi:two-component system, OmpR family, alkaline phosphatase synthesis response regulator PhoP
MNKILIIDNEAVTRDVILEVLTLGNFDAITASSGQQGIRLAQKHLPSLILCDIMMPDVDGYEVLSTLQQEPSTASIPFIFLTARSQRSDLRQGMELGADDYLTKPFTGAELLSAVTTQLDKRDRVQHQTAQQSSQISALRQELKELHTLSEHKEKLLENLSQGLRAPLSNIQMALRMLDSTSDAQRARYLEVLKEECSREIALVNQVTELRDLLSPENARLLKSFDLLK